MERGKSFWIARISAIVFILFISIFAFDSFAAGLAFSEAIIVFFIQLIPSSILTIFLIVFWNKSKYSGVIWILFGIVYFFLILPAIIRDFQLYQLSWIVLFSGISFVIAYLFFRDAKK